MMRTEMGCLRARQKCALAIALLFLVAGCGGEGDVSGSEATHADNPSSGEAWFRDVTTDAGIRFKHEALSERRFWFPEIMGSGLGFGDVDDDGYLELYLVQSGELGESSDNAQTNRMLRNRADGTFEDVTGSSGTGDQGYGMGCAFGDADEDGDLDLYVTNVGPNALFQNEGDVVFTDETEAAGVGEGRWGTSCGFLDYDADGDLDLFVVNYLNWSSDRELPCSSAYGVEDYCNPNNYNAPASDVLYRNEGGMRFTDVSEATGIARVFGNGLGLATGDFDGDGRVDIYVANDLMANQLWRGQADGTFVDDALLAGCAVALDGGVEAGMGVLAMDMENDGDLDLFMTHLREESNTFYLNEGELFIDNTAMMGLSSPSFPFTGFGVGAADFDRDGYQDLYVANGRVTFGRPLFDADDPFAEPNQLFRGVKGAGFEEVLPRGGVRPAIIGNSRGLALGDYDNDGDVDVAVLDNGGGVHLLENVLERQEHWIQIRVCTKNGRDAYGALVGVGDVKRQWRQVQAAYSYCSSNDPRVHFGLGSASGPVEVEVVWDGRKQRFGPLEIDRIHTLRME